MDWLRQLPLGQYVAGRRGWLRRLDPRLKYAWSLAFLLTPILASPWWRLALVGLLLLITLASGLPWRLWRRSVPLLLSLSLAWALILTSLREKGRDTFTNHDIVLFLSRTAGHVIRVRSYIPVFSSIL